MHRIEHPPEAAAVSAFSLTEEQRKRLVVQQQEQRKRLVVQERR
jgi:hypothetical protein